MRMMLQLSLLGLLQLATLPSETRPAALSWWTIGPMAKVHPGGLPPEHPDRRVNIFAGRNEFEPFQIIVRANAEDVSGLDVDISDLTGDQGEQISKSNATPYVEQFINITQPTMKSGSPGLWPDALVPRTDRYAHERRNAFPFRVRRGEDQPLWIEVFVPPETVPGKYSGSVSILQNGGVKFSVPITLTVWNFTLPVTSSLPSSFGLNGTTALKQHKGGYTSDEDLYRITRVYEQAALQHRISIHGGSNVPPRLKGEGDELKLEWHNYDEEMGPLLDGRAIPKNEPLYGARATSTDLRLPSEFPDRVTQSLYLREWVKHFAKHGWSDRLFLYLWDEPEPAVYPKVKMRGEAVLHDEPSIRDLVTVPFTPKLEQVVKIWVPLVNCLEPRPGSDDFCHEKPALADYESELAKGKSLWFYQSCASHGCGGKGGEYFEGWPSYMIDAAGTSNRVMQWIAWKYRMQGELYYSMNEAYAHAGDPWTDLFLSGGNGDGTLFYPGKPSRIGGHTDIPIESIRLKLIREGMEDYEYLTMLAAAKGRKAADEFADRIVQKPWNSENRPDKFAQVRREMGEMLNHLGPAPDTGR